MQKNDKMAMEHSDAKITQNCIYTCMETDKVTDRQSGVQKRQHSGYDRVAPVMTAELIPFTPHSSCYHSTIFHTITGLPLAGSYMSHAELASSV